MFIDFVEGDTVAWMGQKYLVRYVNDKRTATIMDMYGAHVEVDYEDCQVII